MISAAEAAHKAAYSHQHIAKMCKDGRIKGAKLESFGQLKFWMIPDDFKISPAKRGRPRDKC